MLDFLAWAGGGLLVGGMLGFIVAEISSRFGRPRDLGEVLSVANRDAYRGAVFFGIVALTGHALRAIF